jgi:predicted choloylglycine hydrolase
MYTLRGSHYEIGKQIAKLKRTIPKLKSINKEKYKKQLQIYQHHYPEFLDEIKGIADSLKLDLDKYTYSKICLVTSIFGCSIFHYDGMIGRNYDFFVNSTDYVEFIKVKPKKFNSYICVSDGDCEVFPKKKDKYGLTVIGKQYYEPVNGDDYINDKNLYIGLLNNPNKKVFNGLFSLDFMRRIAETCGSVKDVLNFIKVTPCMNSQFFFCADGYGNKITIEHFSGLDYKVFTSKNLLIHTNHVLDPKHKMKITKNVKESTNRYNIIKNMCMTNKPKNLLDIKNILDNISCTMKGFNCTIYQLLIDIENKEYYMVWKGKVIKLKI